MTCEKAYDPDCPVVCMDEQPVQLIGETRVPIPATKEHPERADYEYHLNVAECELSCMTSQCVEDRRIGDIETLQTEIAAWSSRMNEKQRAVDWQFTVEKARGKLKRLGPQS